MKNMEISKEMTPAILKKYHSVFPDPDEKDRLCIRIEHGVFAGASIPNLKNALGYTVPPITLVLLPIRGKD